MKTFKKSFKMFRYNFSSIILFEIMFKLISTALLAPVLYTLFNWSVKLADIKYLATENVKQYFKAPSTYAFIFVMMLALVAYFLINISGLIYAMEASEREEKISSVALLLKGVANAIRVISPRNMGLILYVLLLLPVTYTVMISGSLVGIKLPEVFVIFLEKNKLIFTIILLIYAVLCLVSMARIFALNLFTLHKVDFKTACASSKKIIKNNFWKIFFGILLCNACINFALYLLEGTLATALANFMVKHVNYKAFRFAFKTTIQIVFLVLYFIFTTISTPLVYSYICASFYQLEGDMGYQQHIKEKERKRKKHKRNLTPDEKKKKDRLTFWIVTIIALVLNGIYIYLSVKNLVNINMLYSTNTDITAHRGDSKNAPENTLAAIEKAVENQADIIEIDVRQTSDGAYILMHDKSLYRTTGVKKDVGNVDYEFINTLDAGSHFSKEYKGEKVPTLEEALIYGKEHNIFYNIELKPEKTDENFEQGIIDLIEEYEYTDDCVIGCMKYNTLKNIKNINPDIETIYIMTMVVGNIETMEYADGFSIKHSYITADMVNKVHKKGKKIYAWTLNNEEAVKKILLLDVDSIITDDPYWAKNLMYNANSTLISDWIDRLIHEY